MAIFIDPPSWPAHGTCFSHLISDSSLEELHAFAARYEVPTGAFDEDHYDVPARRYDQLITGGAQPVAGRELIRILRDSGLRVPAHRRAGHVLAALQQRWQHLYPEAPALGAELIRRWSQPHRHYHGPTHLLAVLTRLDELAGHASRHAKPSERVRLAAWFHDAVYDGVPGQDEQQSGELARAQLVDPAIGDQVARLVLCTRDHRIPADMEAPLAADAALLLDADLGVLAQSEADYARYVDAVRADYAHVDDPSWRAGRRTVLEQLLAADPLFHTAWAQEQWTATAHFNMRRELAELT